MKAQTPIVAPPQEEDENLEDYTAVIQAVFEEVFQDLHTHDVRTTAPTTSDGEIGDIQLVELETGKFLYIKFKAGWFKVALTAA